MSGADIVDQSLRSGVCSARAKGIRCFKAVVRSDVNREEADGVIRTSNVLSLAKTVKEDTNLSLDHEFSRCCEALVEDSTPCLLFFRSDGMENLASSRWLLVAWLPDAASEAERVVYVRSRGLLSHLVTQPYFLQEFFASSRMDLKWTLASRADRPAPSAGDAPAVATTDARVGVAPSGPLVIGTSLDTMLQRLVNKEEACVRLQLSPVKGSSMKWSGRQIGENAPTGILALEAKSHECTAAAMLAKSAFPATLCYLVTMIRDAETSKDDLVFILWCPDLGVKKDMPRLVEETRYAVMKLEVLQVLVEALPSRPARIFQCDARDPQHITDIIYKATEGFARGNTSIVRSCSRAADREWPTLGGTPADWPQDWPTEACPMSKPSSLALYSRPVGIWRGGSKAHTIVAQETTSPASRSKRTVKLSQRTEI